MAYVKTSGTGFAFTKDESEAMHFASAAHANRVRARLAPQFPNYLWEVVVGPQWCYLMAHSKVGER